MSTIVTLSCRTFSLGRLLIDYALDAANPIAHGDPDGGDEDGRDGVRNAVKSGGYCAAKTTSLIKTLAPRVLQHTPFWAYQRGAFYLALEMHDFLYLATAY